MKTLGIIGGIAPESTIAYYRMLVSGFRERVNDGSYPPVFINSINLARLIELVTGNQQDGMVAYLLPELEKLARAGADFALLSSNTPHLVFDELQRRSPLPLLSIVECAGEATHRAGLRKVGLFGTRFTMQARFYPEVFAKSGVSIVTPNAAEQDFIHGKYMDELIEGVLLPETRGALMGIAERLTREEGIEGLVLGGTELPLILSQPDGGIPFLNTSQIHVERALDEMLA